MLSFFSELFLVYGEKMGKSTHQLFPMLIHPIWAWLPCDTLLLTGSGTAPRALSVTSGLCIASVSLLPLGCFPRRDTGRVLQGAGLQAYPRGQAVMSSDNTSVFFRSLLN